MLWITWIGCNSCTQCMHEDKVGAMAFLCMVSTRLARGCILSLCRSAFFSAPGLAQACHTAFRSHARGLPARTPCWPPSVGVGGRPPLRPPHPRRRHQRRSGRALAQTPNVAPLCFFPPTNELMIFLIPPFFGSQEAQAVWGSPKSCSAPPRILCGGIGRRPGSRCTSPVSPVERSCASMAAGPFPSIRCPSVFLPETHSLKSLLCLKNISLFEFRFQFPHNTQRTPLLPLLSRIEPCRDNTQKNITTSMPFHFLQIHFLL